MREFVLWVRALFFRARVESEMEKEMRLHVEMETENNIRLGMALGEARRQALVAFGGVEVAKESVRDERQTRWLEQLIADMRFALRGFRMRPGFTFGVVTLIALGVGVNTGIFSVVNHLLLNPLPYADGNRMVEFSRMAGGGTVFITPIQSGIDRWKSRATTVQHIVLYRSSEVALGDTTDAHAPRVTSVDISPGALAFIGVKPYLGRDVQPSDTMSDAPPVALISRELWETRFGARRDVVGQLLLIEGTAHRIIGVLPTGTKLPFTDAAPVMIALHTSGGDRPMSAMAKLKPGVSIVQANAELAAMFPKDVRTDEDPPRLMRASDWVSRNTRRTVYLMFGAVVIILIVACANVANLLTARAWSRQREFAIRTAMGASRGRLVRQVFTESVLLAIVGGSLATAVGRATLKILVASRPQSALDFEGARLEPAVLAWCFGIAVLTGIAFGLAPAFFVSAHRTSDALKSGTQSASGSVGARRTRGALVIAEVALSAVLLVASGLLLRSVLAMSRADIGVNTEGLWGVNVSVSGVGDSIARKAAMRDVVQRVRAVPGVENATVALGVPPYFGIGMGQVEIDGRPTRPSDSLTTVNMTAARSDIFAVAGIRIVAGRAFADEERPIEMFGQTGEIVVNESFARRFFPGGNALGAKIRRGVGPFSRIVGIAADVVIPGDQRGERTKTQFYQPMGAAPRRAVLLVRSRAPMMVMLPTIETAVHDVAPAAKVSDERTSESFVAGVRSGHRFLLMLLASFATLALVLAAFGLHAVVSYAVHQRTREIGVRVALGAQATDIARMILGQGLRLSLFGIVLGTGGGWLVAQSMRSMLYDVRPADPITIAATASMLVCVAVLASWAPARRALHVDPVDALRSE